MCLRLTAYFKPACRGKHWIKFRLMEFMFKMYLSLKKKPQILKCYFISWFHLGQRMVQTQINMTFTFMKNVHILLAQHMHTICFWVLCSIWNFLIFRKQVNPPQHITKTATKPCQTVTLQSLRVSAPRSNERKKKKCTVVLLLHLPGRESRRGLTYGPY